MSDFNGLVSCVNMVYQNHVKEQVYMQNIYISLHKNKTTIINAVKERNEEGVWENKKHFG